MKTLPIIQIAIADDHPIVRDSIADFINLLGGFNVYILADNGQDLLEKIDRAAYQPHICIIDINMPVMDGYETMLQLKKKYPLIHGLALSLHTDEYPILKMLKNGASGYLPKTCNRHTLTKALVDVYTTGFYFSDIVLEKFPKISATNIEEYAQNLFTRQQIQLLSLCCSDLNYAQIGREMQLGQRTVENKVQQLFEKLNIHSRIGLAMYAQHIGVGSFYGKSRCFYP